MFRGRLYLITNHGPDATRRTWIGHRPLSQITYGSADIRERPVSDAALREYCNKHYHQLLPLIAEKVHQEKTQQDNLKEVKGRLNFKGCSRRSSKIQEVSQHSESRTPNIKGERERMQRSRCSHNTSQSPEPTSSVFFRIRRDGSESLRNRISKREAVFRRLGRKKKCVFNRLGGKARSVSACSSDSKPQQHQNAQREAESRYQSSRLRKAEPIPRKRYHEGASSQRTEVFSESEDSRGGYWKSRSKKQKSSIEEDDVSQPWVCEETNPFTPRIRYFYFPKRPGCQVTVWFNDLPLEFVDSYDDLKKAFLANFLQQKKYINDPSESYHIKQREGESTKDFVQRFKTESGYVKGAPECMRISGFMHGITNPELIKRLCDKISKLVDEMIRITIAFLRGEPKAAKKGEASGKDKSIEILMVQPWQRVARQRVTQSFSPDLEILFPPLGDEDEAKGPMIIEPDIGGYFIHHIYVDGGSDSEILYKHCFNRMCPEVESQMVPATAPLIVVRSPSPYNGIIGRPRVRKIQAVPSTAHGMLKFPVPGGILTLRSSKIIPLECTMVSGPEAQPSASTRVAEEKIKVAHHPKYPEQTIAIGSTLTEKGRKVLCGLLRRNLDIFTWKPADMTGVPRHIAEHRLNVREGCPPVREKKRSQARKETRDRLEGGIPLRIPLQMLPKCVQRIPPNKHGKGGRGKNNIHHQPGDILLFKNDFWFKEFRSDLPTFGRQGILEANWQELGAKSQEMHLQGRSGNVPGIDEITRRLQKWSIELGEYDIQYKPRISVKGQILVDFILERPKDDSLAAPMEVEEELLDPWTLFIEGSSSIDGFGAGLILTDPEGIEFTYALRFRFDATNNEAEYEALIAGLRIAEQIGVKNLQKHVDSRLVANQINGSYIAKEPGMIQYLEKVKTLASSFKKFSIKQVPRSENKKADALSKIASTSFAHLTKQVLVEELKEKSINEAEVLAIMEEEGNT
ncbi:reverse transcriptase domain-containing protein [Tanacetum coccineum]